MYRTILPFYVICFGLYIFFSRQPDYTDGEFTTGIVHFIKDSASQQSIAKTSFTIDKTLYTINAAYPLRHLTEGQKINIIYEASDPKRASVYLFLGYWIKWNELIASIVIPFVLLYAAKAITSNPTPEALIEDMEMNSSSKRRKYD